MCGRLRASVIPEAHLEQCHSEALAGGYLAAWRASLQRAAHINARERSHPGLPVSSGQAGWHGAGLQKGGWLVRNHTETQTNQTRKQTNNHTNETVSKQTNDKTIKQKSMTRQPSMETINATFAFCESQVGRTSGRMKTSPDV